LALFPRPFSKEREAEQVSGVLSVQASYRFASWMPALDRKGDGCIPLNRWGNAESRCLISQGKESEKRQKSVKNYDFGKLRNKQANFLALNSKKSLKTSKTI
jgi:hypothetical protein